MHLLFNGAVALDLIVMHVKRKLKERGLNFREQLLNAHQGERMPDTLFVLPSTKQIKVYNQNLYSI